MKSITQLFSVVAILIILLLLSCKNSHSIDNENNQTKFKIIKGINTILLKNIYAEWRDVDFAIIRYNTSCDSYQQEISLLVKRTNPNLLQFEYQNRWVCLDSVDQLTNFNNKGLSKETINYSFSLLENKNIDKISHDCEHKALFITMGKTRFYYVEDSSYFLKHKIQERLIKLDENWWVDK
jgi:hypothetical protein